MRAVLPMARVAIDGNESAAYVAHKVNEVIAIHLISSPMESVRPLVGEAAEYLGLNPEQRECPCHAARAGALYCPARNLEVVALHSPLDELDLGRR